MTQTLPENHRILVLERCYLMQHDLDSFKLDDDQFCIVLDTMTAAADDTKMACVEYVRNLATDLEHMDTKLSKQAAEILDTAAIGIQSIPV